MWLLFFAVLIFLGPAACQQTWESSPVDLAEFLAGASCPSPGHCQLRRGSTTTLLVPNDTVLEAPLTIRGDGLSTTLGFQGRFGIAPGMYS
jgi:hypothetical protein